VSGPESGTKATIAALAANTGISTAKFVAFAFTGSASMLAEGIHSVADTSNQALLLVGVRRSRREPTPQHPFGYGRERYFWAFMVSVVLFTVGCVFSMYEGVEKIRHPHEVGSLTWAFAVLGVSIVLEALSFRTAVHEARQVRAPGEGWWTFIRHAKAPELPVLLLEDLGALVGLVFALGGVTLAEVTLDPRFDALGSLAIGVLLGAIAAILAVELRSLLIGESASPADIRAIEETLRSGDGVVDVLHVRTAHIGPDDVLVAAKVRFRDDLHFGEIADAINAIEARVRGRIPAAKNIYIEPDTEPTRHWPAT
jgi:cation diffusion facilitator family transporter